MPRPGKGERQPGSGRKPGVPNKITTDLRKVWIEVFDKRGGTDALLNWSRDNPDGFYQAMTKLFPRDVNLAVGTTLEDLLAKARAVPPPPDHPANK